MNLPANDIKDVFPCKYQHDGIFILKNGEPICWWIKNRPYPLEIGSIKGNKTVNNCFQLVRTIVFLFQNNGDFLIEDLPTGSTCITNIKNKKSIAFTPSVNFPFILRIGSLENCVYKEIKTPQEFLEALK